MHSADSHATIKRAGQCLRSKNENGNAQRRVADAVGQPSSDGATATANWASPDGRPGFASVNGRQHGCCQPKPTTLPFGGQ